MPSKIKSFFVLFSSLLIISFSLPGSAKSLHQAVTDGDTTAVKELLQHNTDINNQDESGATALLNASRAGQTDIVKLLLEHNADPDLKNSWGNTPLMQASGSGHTDIVKLLLNNKANVKAKGKYYVTALHKASGNGHTDIVRILIENGAKIDAWEDMVGTPLKKAVRANHLETAALLLAKGANINHPKFQHQQTPLTAAVANKSIPMLKLLLANGADYMPTKRGQNGFLTAIYLPQNEAAKDEILEIFLANGASFQGCKKPADLLFNALQQKRLDVLRLLLKYGTDVNQEIQFRKFSPLYYACEQGMTDYVLELIKYGAKIDSQFTRKMMSPLMAAVKKGHKDTVSVLLKNKANPDIQDTAGNTSLHLAVENEDFAVVSMLLAAGASRQIDNKKGMTAVDLAAKKNNSQIFPPAQAATIPEKKKINTAKNTISSTDKSQKATNTGKEERIKINRIKLLTFDQLTKIAGIKDSNVNIDFTDLLHKTCKGLKSKAADPRQIIKSIIILGGTNLTKNYLEAADKNGISPLCTACQWGQIEIVSLLLELGAKTRFDHQGHSTLDYAILPKLADAPYVAQNTRFKIIKLLVQHGAKITTIKNIDTIYLGASPKMVKELVKYNVDLNNYKNRPLIIEAARANDDLVMFLINNGADTLVRDPQTKETLAEIIGKRKNKQTQKTFANIDLLYNGIINNNIEDVEKAINSGLNINIRFTKGNTPLHLAIEKSRHKIIKFLLANGADINAENKAGQIPLQKAVSFYNCDISIVKKYIHRGWDINSKLNSRGTLLQSTVYYVTHPLKRDLADSYQLLIAYLLKNGANVNIENEKGLTSLDIARGKGKNNHIIALLKANGGLTSFEKMANKDKIKSTLKKLISQALPTDDLINLNLQTDWPENITGLTSSSQSTISNEIFTAIIEIISSDKRLNLEQINDFIQQVIAYTKRKHLNRQTSLLLIALGQIHNIGDETEKELECYRQSQRLAEKNNLPAIAALSCLKNGVTHYKNGHILQSVKILKIGLNYCTRPTEENQSLISYIKLRLAMCLVDLGQYTQAIELFEQIKETISTTEDINAIQAEALLYSAFVYYKFGHYDKSQEDIMANIAEFKQSQNSVQVIFNDGVHKYTSEYVPKLTIARILLMKFHKDAKNVYDSSLQLSMSNVSEYFYALSYDPAAIYNGVLYPFASSEQKDLSQKYWQEKLSSAEKEKNFVIIATLANIAGEFIYQRWNQKFSSILMSDKNAYKKWWNSYPIEEITGYFRKALNADRKTGRKPNIAYDLVKLGDIYRIAGQYKQAAAYYEEAIHLIESIRKNASGDIRLHYLESQLDAYRNLAECYLQLENNNMLLNAIEQSRARLLAERIAKIDSKIDIPELEEIQKSLAEDEVILLFSNIDRKSFFIMVINSKEVAVKEISKFEFLENSRKQYKKQVLMLMEKKRGMKLKKPDKKAPQAFENKKEQADFNTAIHYYRSLLTNPDNQQETRQFGKLLHTLLIKPVASELAGKTKLTIMPDGILGFLPFGTLVDTKSSKYLTQEYSIGYTQSLTIDKLLDGRKYTRNRKPLLALGGAIYKQSYSKNKVVDNADQLASLQKQTDLDIGQKRSSRSSYEKLGYASWSDLPGTLGEVNALSGIINNGETLTGQDVTENIIKRYSQEGKLADYKIIHFATHGLVVPEIPELSAIVLSQFKKEKDGEDGYLRMGEIANLNLAADFVNLSACETGLGRIIGGEGVIGLTQSFLIAGANGISVSLWQVADKSTALFMTEFYKKINNDDIDYNQALTEIKRGFINGDYGEKYKAPVYWSPFVYYGK